ncbi:hypothetical protein LCGC14_2382370 [marine sediment metagenome]|uniref:Uncharacterized protein n=1 Tax=marine sediment metagenome TaxID=412755 RepID=A0A0F9ED01_9ZZZZ
METSNRKVRAQSPPTPKHCQARRTRRHPQPDRIALATAQAAIIKLLAKAILESRRK